MTIVLIVITVVLQLLVGQLLGFGGAMALGVGNGVELVIIPLGNALGIWGVGALAALLRGITATHALVLRLFGTLIGAAIGALVILLTPATGFTQLLYPLLGALAGYYVAPMFMQRRNIAG